MKTSEVIERCARFMGWKLSKLYQVCGFAQIGSEYWCKLAEEKIGGTKLERVISPGDYNPATNISQAADLKARLMKLDYGYKILGNVKRKEWSATVLGALNDRPGQEWCSVSKVSEEEAIANAVAQMQEA